MREPNRLQSESHPNVMRDAPTADAGVVRVTRAPDKRARRPTPGRALLGLAAQLIGGLLVLAWLVELSPLAAIAWLGLIVVGWLVQLTRRASRTEASLARDVYESLSARGEQAATELSRDVGVNWLLSGFTPLSLLVAVLGAEGLGLMFFLTAPSSAEAVGPLALFVLPPAALGFVFGLWLGRWGALATLLPVPIACVFGGYSANEPPPLEHYVFWWLVTAAPIAIGWVTGWATGIRLARLDRARPRRVGMPPAGVSRPTAAGGRRVGRTTSWPTTRRSPYGRKHPPPS